MIDAIPYLDEITAATQMRFGIPAPVALVVAQIARESGFRPNAISSAGAQGIMQFMPSTAKWAATQAGFPISPLEPRSAIRGGVWFDRFLYERIQPPVADNCNRWLFTLAAYNGGGARLERERDLCTSALVCGPYSGAYFRSVIRTGAPALTSESPQQISRLVSSGPTLPAGIDLRNPLLRFLRVLVPEKVIGWTKAAMLPVVLPLRHDGEIVRKEVRPISVDVMDEDTSLQDRAFDALGHEPMNITQARFAGNPWNVNARVAIQQNNRLPRANAELEQNLSMRVAEIGKAHGCNCNAAKWADVAQFNAGRSEANWLENRRYGPSIVFDIQPKYASVGALVCGGRQ